MQSEPNRTEQNRTLITEPIEMDRNDKKHYKKLIKPKWIKNEQNAHKQPELIENRKEPYKPK